MSSEASTETQPSGLGPVLFVALMVFIFGMEPAREAFQTLFQGETSTVLDLSSEDLSISGSATLSVQENVAVLVPTADLATSTLVMLAGARLLLLAGLIACAVLTAQALIRLRRGDAFTDPTIRGLTRLYTVGIFIWAAYLFMLQFGANMIVRDLEIEGDGASGFWVADRFWYGFIVLLILTVFTEALRQGKKNQDELEGLV